MDVHGLSKFNLAKVNTIYKFCVYFVPRSFDKKVLLSIFYYFCEKQQELPLDVPLESVIMPLAISEVKMFDQEQT